MNPNETSAEMLAIGRAAESMTLGAVLAAQFQRAYPVENLTDNLATIPLSEIARRIRKDWRPKIYFGAVPYLEALAELSDIKDNFYCDSGSSVVAYFLANAQTWKGPVAREIKKELNRRLKQCY